MKRLLSLLLALIMLFALSVPAFASVATFGSTGSGSNPFNPRGYYVYLKDGSKYWLSSKFNTPSSTASDELGHTVQYTGTESGLDFIDAEKIDKLYSITDRNPTPGYKYLVAYSKDSSSKSLATVPGFQDKIQTPGRYGVTDPNGSAGWTIPITFEFEPGTVYEFAYLRGMQANNGVTCVISEDKSGYLKMPLTSEEQVAFDKYKNDEYQYLTSASQNADGEWELTFVPMRYRIQTYADVSAWTSESEKAHELLDSITSADIANHKYREENVENLRSLVTEYDERVESTVKKYLKVEADKAIEEMVAAIELAYNDVLNDTPTLADLTKYNKALAEAKTLYNVSKDNVGTSNGQYGKEQVEKLNETITTAENTVGEYTKQSIVDAQTTALERAIAAVKASMVVEGELRFYDSTTGVTVIAKAGSLPENAKLFVGQYGENESLYSKTRDKLDSSPSYILIYEIRFYVGQVEVKPTEQVKIQIPVGDDMKFEIRSLNSNGESVYLNSKFAGETQVFNSDEMGLFAVLLFDENTEKPSKDNGSSSSSDEKVDVLKKTDTDKDKQQEVNQLKEEEEKTQQIKEREPKKRETSPLSTDGVDLSKITRDLNSNEIVLVGAGMAVLGVCCGAFEYIRSKREEDLFV